MDKEDNRMKYTCGDGNSYVFPKPLSGNSEKLLADKHKGIKDVKKVKSV